jgi:hypothetical protein
MFTASSRARSATVKSPRPRGDEFWPAASRLQSGAMPVAMRGSARPRRAQYWATSVADAMSHSLTYWSDPPEASCLPSGEILHTRNRAIVRRQNNGSAAPIGVPDAKGAVLGGGDDRVRERAVANGTAMSSQSGDRLSGPHVPHVQDAVFAAGDQARSVRRESRGVDRRVVSTQRVEAARPLPRPRLPLFCRASRRRSGRHWLP